MTLTDADSANTATSTTSDADPVVTININSTAPRMKEDESGMGFSLPAYGIPLLVIIALVLLFNSILILTVGFVILRVSRTHPQNGT